MRGMIKLQVLTSAEWHVWRDLRLRALEEAPYAFGSRLEDWQDAAEERWRERLELPGSHNLIARMDGKPVGMATGAPGNERYELISMWVAPEARGRGVGDALITGVARWARERRASELWLDVTEQNERAIRLYVRHGFVDAGPSGEDGGRMMVKPL